MTILQSGLFLLDACTIPPPHLDPPYHLHMLYMFIDTQGPRSAELWAEIRPHSQCQKVWVFSQFQTKIPNLTKPNTWSQKATDVSVENIH